DVDDDAGLGQPHVEQRHEALAAGQQLGLVAVLGEQRQRLVDRRGPAVGEGCRLHRAPSRRAASIASHTRRGVIGVWQIDTPKSCRASVTALAMAAGGAMAPPSPMPFMPSTVKGDSVSRWATAMSGISVAPGSR